MDTVRQLFDKATINVGWTLDPLQVRSLVVFIQQIDAALADLHAKSEVADSMADMFAAYMNEYGEELYNELLANNEAVVEGEVEEEVVVFESPYDDDGYDGAYEKEVEASGDEIEGEIGQTS